MYWRALRSLHPRGHMNRHVNRHLHVCKFPRVCSSHAFRISIKLQSTHRSKGLFCYFCLVLNNLKNIFIDLWKLLIYFHKKEKNSICFSFMGRGLVIASCLILFCFGIFLSYRFFCLLWFSFSFLFFWEKENLKLSGKGWEDLRVGGGKIWSKYIVLVNVKEAVDLKENGEEHRGGLGERKGEEETL